MYEKERGSIMAYMYKQLPMRIYEDDVPQNFETPCMYFPGTMDSDSNDTNMSFSLHRTLHVKLFDKNKQSALAKAVQIANSIRESRMLVPLLDPAGANTGMWVRITSLNTRIIDDHAAQISVDWTTRYLYFREDVPLITDININSEVRDNE